VSVILLHNHPSGDPSPSLEDIRTTERMAKAGELLGIPLKDHIIIGQDSYISLNAEGYLNFE
jgi:DNA repair protein RadC